MNWEAIGAIGELVGALAVVITLAYLAAQVRYAKITASDSNRLVRASGVREMYQALVNQPAIGIDLAAADPQADAYYRAFAEAFDVSLEQAIRLDSQCHYYFWLHWGQFASSKTPADIADLRNLARGFYRVPYVNYVWENAPYAKSLLESRFVEFIDAILAEPDASPPT